MTDYHRRAPDLTEAHFVFQTATTFPLKVSTSLSPCRECLAIFRSHQLAVLMVLALKDSGANDEVRHCANLWLFATY